jgi:hypothetical protein
VDRGAASSRIAGSRAAPDEDGTAGVARLLASRAGDRFVVGAAAGSTTSPRIAASACRMCSSAAILTSSARSATNVATVASISAWVLI